MIIQLTEDNALVYKKDILECLSDGFNHTTIEDNAFVLLCLEKSSFNHKTFMRLLHGEVVSLVTLILEPKLIHNGSIIGHIEDVCTKTKYRSEGYSTELLEYACDFAKNCGCYKVILDSKLDGFYERLGFRVVEKCYRKDL